MLEKLKTNSAVISLYQHIARTPLKSLLPSHRRRSAIEYVCLDEGISLIKNRLSGATYFFPYKRRKEFSTIQLHILANGFDSHLLEKYTAKEFCVSGDTVVVDCGGFIGGFSIAASKMGAERVVYIEPTPISRRCAELNFAIHECQNISVHAAALGAEPGEAILNLSSSGADNSILEPDEGSLNQSVPVELTTMETIAKAEQLDPQKTFLKVEAEGFEPEIIKGLGGFLPKQVVVDISPERGGTSPCEEVQALLSERGYGGWYRTDRCLFAMRGQT